VNISVWNLAIIIRIFLFVWASLASIWQHIKLWWLEVKREYYQNCFIYCQRATSSMGTVNINSSYSPVGPWVCLFVFFGLHDLSLCWCIFFIPWTVESFPCTFWHWCSKLEWAPFEFFAPSHYCGLGAGSIPLRAIVNKKQCETKGLFMSLVIHYWIGDVQDSQGVSIPVNANYKF